ncbi:hypothetical protein FM996_11265 [Methylosinus sporium]|uniref:Uncharacterized protein n=1 Tax=Methylosinus sporium TaxID=428 RepID=A0A549SU19_METSR|nr:hypothetical protein [Methylosinus sporium]TRL33057.1 hypothetical protein FM996_11265 [Methylosinus sporium]
MISEVAFARDFSAFWRTVTPTLEGFIRRMNRGLYDRDDVPMQTMTAANRRAYVNEVAFETFCVVSLRGQHAEVAQTAEATIAAAADTVKRSASSIPSDGDYEDEFNSAEIQDIKEQVRRLTKRLVTPGSHRLYKPEFRGCGIIDTCRGDALVGNTLFEVKAGDRSFRSIDVRQLLTYLALNFVSGQYGIRFGGLVNPRIGVSFEVEVEELCFEVSGRDASGLLSDISYAISSGEISR